jgi:hypothetical protein
MSKENTVKNERNISRAATIIVFLALIRVLSEVFRLQYYSSASLTFEKIKPFLLGALICSISCLLMLILSFWSKYKFIIAVSILTIVSLLVLKYSFAI